MDRLVEKPGLLTLEKMLWSIYISIAIRKKYVKIVLFTTSSIPIFHHKFFILDRKRRAIRKNERTRNTRRTLGSTVRYDSPNRRCNLFDNDFHFLKLNFIFFFVFKWTPDGQPATIPDYAGARLDKPINWAEEAEQDQQFNAPAPQIQQGVNEWGGSSNW